MIDRGFPEEIYKEYYREFSTHEKKFSCRDLAVGNMFFAMCYLLKSFEGDDELSKKVVQQVFKESMVWLKGFLASQENGEEEDGLDKG
jgi:hypothetical protein